MKVVIEPKATEYDDSLYDAPRVIERWICRIRVCRRRCVGESYYKEGYIVIRQALDAQLVEEARRELEAMTNSDQPNCKVVMFEGQIRDYIGGKERGPLKRTRRKERSPKPEARRTSFSLSVIPGVNYRAYPRIFAENL